MSFQVRDSFDILTSKLPYYRLDVTSCTLIQKDLELLAMDKTYDYQASTALLLSLHAEVAQLRQQQPH